MYDKFRQFVNSRQKVLRIINFMYLLKNKICKITKKFSSHLVKSTLEAPQYQSQKLQSNEKKTLN